jgi:hypothetical protein
MNGYLKAIILTVLGLSLFIPLASTFPDGLETVAETFDVGEHGRFWQGIMPDYSLPWISNAYVSTFMSGVLGTLLVLAIAFFVGKALTKNSEP